ncbi:SPFH domain-containing protein [Streptomyces sp. NPDC059567]|uniref:SPFH domain-containing protein n=1 Tax=Streptomyces sp. NPDC059567 TaxID=3346867 RepID=UPI003674E668
MTRSTPNPDSGAAASRDAARSAIRLTDETRPPRRHAPETSRNGPTPGAGGGGDGSPAAPGGAGSVASAPASEARTKTSENGTAGGGAPKASATSDAPGAPTTGGGLEAGSGVSAATGGGAGSDSNDRPGTPAAASGADDRLGSPAASATSPGAPNTAGGSPGASAAPSGGPTTAAGLGTRSGVSAAGGGAAGVGPDARPGSAVGSAGSAPADGSDVLGGPGARPDVPTDWPGSPWASAGSVTPSGGPQTSSGAHRPGSPDEATPGKRSGAAGRVDEMRRIIGAAEVGVIAVPVAAEAPAAVPAAAPRIGGRRKTVIGAETTGSIPVHLLFRDEPEPDDDGGPATIAMAPTVVAKAVIPAPTRPEPARPAPTADPKLVERDGAVLPGWIGIVGGLLALAGCAAVLWWAGAVPGELARMLRVTPRPYHGIHLGQWALLALGVLAVLFTLGGLGRGRVGYAWVLTLFGDYRGSVRRTGLVWVSPLLLRRRVDVRLRHWRSEPLSSVDAKGTALRVVVLVVWRIRDTVRAALGVDGHEEYLREQVEAAMARVLSQLPADAFHEDAPTLRDAEAVGEALTRMLSAECAPVGIDVFSAQPTRIEYAPEIAAAMQRRRIAAIDAKHRDSVLTSVVDAVDDVVHRLTTRGLVELDDYERKALVKDLTVAFYTGRTGPVEGA